jgi:hypothetical protein
MLVMKMEADIYNIILSFIHQRLYSPGAVDSFQFHNHFYTDGRTPGMSDQPVARPLPSHRATQTQNKCTDIHAFSGIRTHDPTV